MCDTGHMLSQNGQRKMSSRARLCSTLAAFFLILSACGGSAEATSADAGADSSVVAGEAPVFDGCASTGDIVNYQWVIVETPEGNAEDAGKFLREESTDCSFTLENVMEVDEVGVWTIELSVEDAEGTVASDTVAVTVTES